MPHLKGPVAFSQLPTNEFKNGDDTGLVMQGMFGGIQIRPELIHKVFLNLYWTLLICITFCFIAYSILKYPVKGREVK